MTFIDKLVGPEGQQALHELQLRDLRVWKHLMNFLNEVIRLETPRLRAILSHLPSLPSELMELNTADPLLGSNNVNTKTTNRMDIFYQNLWHGLKGRLEKQLRSNSFLEEKVIPRLQDLIAIREELLKIFHSMSENMEKQKKINMERLLLSKKRYCKLLQRVISLKQQYTVLINKGRLPDKIRALQLQWQKKLSQLHNEHNHLLVCIFHHNSYQRLLHERMQPALIDYTESVMRLTVEAIRKLLEDSCPYLDVNLAIIRSIDPPHEYEVWLKHLRIDFTPPDSEPFPSIPEDYSGPLQENILQVDQATYYDLENLKVSYEKERTQYRASLSNYQRQSDQKRNELAQLRAARIQDTSDTCQEYTWMEFHGGMEIRLELYFLEVNISIMNTLYELQDAMVHFIHSAFPPTLSHPSSTATAGRNLCNDSSPAISYLPKLPSLNNLMIENLSIITMRKSSSHDSDSHDAFTENTQELGECGGTLRVVAAPMPSSSDLENPSFTPPSSESATNNSSNRASVNGVFQGFRRSIGATISRRFRQFSQADKRRILLEEVPSETTTPSSNSSQINPVDVKRHSSMDESAATAAGDMNNDTHRLPQTQTMIFNGVTSGRSQESYVGENCNNLVTGGDNDPNTITSHTVDMRHFQHRLSLHDFDKSAMPQQMGERSWPLLEMVTQQDFTKKKWFHGVLPREEISRLLQEDGDYLVRCSEKGPSNSTSSGVFPGSNSTASVTSNSQSRIVLSVYQDGPRHFIINQTPSGHWYLKETRIFASVCDLITHYVTTREPISSKRMESYLRRAVLRPSWQLDNDDIILGRRLGRGNFGDVFLATYSGREVAVKTCRADVSHEEVRRKFLQGETTVLKFNHPNIVRLLGIAVQKQPIMIVMEFVPDGALNRYLLRNRSNIDGTTLLKICLDVSRGMEYLEAHKCIHRDLAARNCLVDARASQRNETLLSGDATVPSLCVKVADFGLARCSTSGYLTEEQEVAESDIAVYQLSVGTTQHIPVKWTAPEVMRTARYTSLCDVWSYGILLWEVFSFGEVPYPGMSNSQAREEVEKGYRMPPPANMPQMVSMLMSQCWDARPEKRPHFNEITTRIQALITSHFTS